MFRSLLLSCAVIQEHIIHGDLKASNVLLKTCAPTTITAAAPGAAAGHQGSAATAAAAGDPAAAAASRGIIDAAAAAAVEKETSASGMRSLLKCGWVVAKVSDFGLSMCVNPEETHVSSVHAVSVCVCGGGRVRARVEHVVAVAGLPQ